MIFDLETKFNNDLPMLRQGPQLPERDVRAVEGVRVEPRGHHRPLLALLLRGAGPGGVPQGDAGVRAGTNYEYYSA